MQPFLTKELAQQRIGDLRRSARKNRVREDVPELDGESLTVRGLDKKDGEAIRLLAALEGRHVPTVPALVAELNDELVAALPLDGGKPLADPFRPTAHIVSLLELRARQLRAA